MATITVGMPIFNAAPLLAKALDCIVNQTYRDFELIVSDNASTDGSVAIVEAYAKRDSRIRLYRQETNCGITANFNFVLDRATSEFFCWRAYDDWSDENWLEALHGCLEKSPGRMLAASSVIRINPDDSPSRRSPYPELAHVSRVRRVVKLMKVARAPWIYGLFRREALVRHFRAAESGFPFAWALDHATLLALIFEDGITGSADTWFYQRRVPKPGPGYRITDLGARWRHLIAFVAYSLRVWWRCPLTPWEKAICLLYLPAYANRKAAKLSRLVRSTLAWPFQRRRSVDSIQGGRA